MEVIELFAGIGGMHLGLKSAIPSARVIEAVEINPLSRYVYSCHFPEVRLHEDGDIRNYHPPRNWEGREGIICGGFPCTDTSSAGKRAGLSGEESGLWWEMARVIDEASPTFIVLENPDGLRHRGLLDILRHLAERGYDAEWQTISIARLSGAPHWRERLFIIAYPHHLSSRIEGAESWSEQLRSEIEKVTDPGRTGQKRGGGGYSAHSDRHIPHAGPKDEFGCPPISDAVPPWLGGIASDEWCAIWNPPPHPGRPKTSNSPNFPLERWVNNHAISLYGLSCCPQQAEIAFRRVAYLSSFL